MIAMPVVVLFQAAAPAAASPMSMLFPMVAVFLIFYLLLIRPQQKKQKEHEQLLQAIDRGDRVVTGGGVHGVVTGTSDDVLTVEIANVKGERVRIKVDRGRIDRVLEKAKGGEDS